MFSGTREYLVKEALTRAEEAATIAANEKISNIDTRLA